MSAQVVNTIISTKNLSMKYKYYEKEEGLKGSIKNLFHKKYLYKEAVKGIDLDIKQGEIVGLIGMNGAGKTTTLKMLSGLLEPIDGEINVMGYTPFYKEKDFLKQISMIMGNKSQLWWDLPAVESFNLNAHIYEIPNEKYKKNLQQMVDLFQVEKLLNTQVRRLSLGERMKMELIASLIHLPQVIFLDEPTIGLDVIAQYNIRNFLKKYREMYGATIILTSHNFEDIISLCDKLILLNQGSIIYNDSFDKFAKRFSEDKRISVMVGNNLSEVVKIFESVGIQINSKTEDTIELLIPQKQVHNLLNIISAGDNSKFFDDIQIRNIDMDEIVRRIYAQ